MKRGDEVTRGQFIKSFFFSARQSASFSVLSILSCVTGIIHSDHKFCKYLLCRWSIFMTPTLFRNCTDSYERF